MKKPPAISLKPAVDDTRKQSAVLGIVRIMAAWPRVIRIPVVIVFALAATAAVFPLVDALYIRYLFVPGGIDVSAWISAAVGALTYIVGWRFFVGTRGEQPQANWITLLYLLLGGIFVVVVAVLFLQGLAMGTQI